MQPDIQAAKVALERNDVTPVLRWVKKDGEAEVKAAFAKTLTVRAKCVEAINAFTGLLIDVTSTREITTPKETDTKKPMIKTTAVPDNELTDFAEATEMSLMLISELFLTNAKI